MSQANPVKDRFDKFPPFGTRFWTVTKINWCRNGTEYGETIEVRTGTIQPPRWRNDCVTIKFDDISNGYPASLEGLNSFCRRDGAIWSESEAMDRFEAIRAEILADLEKAKSKAHLPWDKRIATATNFTFHKPNE